MAQAGLHAAAAYQLRHYIPYERRLFPALIFGALLPDVDIIVVAIGSIFFPISESIDIFHRSFSHNFFTIIITYLIFAILSEIKKKPEIKSVGKGIALGILTHCVIDTFIWFSKIDILWPLPINAINLWHSWIIPNKLYNILLMMEFFCFRWYAWFLITRHLANPGKRSWFIKYLNVWKSIETYLVLLFIIFIIWPPSSFHVLFAISYIPSLIMALYSTYISRDTLEFEAKYN